MIWSLSVDLAKYRYPRRYLSYIILRKMVLVLQIGPGSNKIRAKIISDLSSSKYTPVTNRYF